MAAVPEPAEVVTTAPRNVSLPPGVCALTQRPGEIVYVPEGW